MKSSLRHLQKRIASATGADRDLDAEIARALVETDGDALDYTASVDRCLDLLQTRLPAWHWHLGRGPSGVMPYASLTKGEATVSADGTTVPLVLLAVIFKALAR
jgi:hypothetical protein